MRRDNAISTYPFSFIRNCCIQIEDDSKSSLIIDLGTHFSRNLDSIIDNISKRSFPIDNNAAGTSKEPMTLSRIVAAQVLVSNSPRQMVQIRTADQSRINSDDDSQKSEGGEEPGLHRSYSDIIVPRFNYAVNRKFCR